MPLEHAHRYISGIVVAKSSISWVDLAASNQFMSTSPSICQLSSYRSQVFLSSVGWLDIQSSSRESHRPTCNEDSFEDLRATATDFFLCRCMHLHVHSIEFEFDAACRWVCLQIFLEVLTFWKGSDQFVVANYCPPSPAALDSQSAQISLFKSWA